ncbi:LacI family DNA-binding transcriptional regulator [Sphingomonas sp. PAMC 26621]|uniref:LacI family DNA-binding transcriptional regulator n=1 Tax=Sphingomonas sp. PAMC 26621 TaxID=1112213 RepID=UPI0002882D1B|nr:LacI family DNA-binding transcriptional regulator [Sphingomonas sp. PAMC 26621]
MKDVSIKDVAARAGVSPKTVSRVINGEQHVRPEVRDVVLRVVAELDYRPNIFARSLSSSRSYLLGLFLDDPSSGYASDVQLGALLRCRERSYHLIVEPVDLAKANWEHQIESSIRGLRLDGAILTPPLCDDPRVIEIVTAAGIPFVRISPRGDPEVSGAVEMDEFAAAIDMTRHLIDLGHCEIGFIMGDPQHDSSRKRYDGFRYAMTSAGLGVKESFMMQGDFSMRSALGPAERLLGTPDRPTAIFASNDDMALAALITAMKFGIAVPEALSICGFDDAPSARTAWPSLTTIRQPKAEMAAASVDMLVDPFYRTRADDERFHRLLPYELIKRQSTGRAPGMDNVEA